MVRSALVLSDIHLGASTSLLTAWDVDAETGSPVQRPLAQAVLDKLLADIRSCLLPDQKIEQCILLGDIFEFSFAPYGLAMQNGKWFFTQLLESGLFEQLVYIPGNHDHHLWQQICEHYYLMTTLDNPPLNYPRTLPTTVVLQNTFLDGLLPEGHGFHITYPNYEFSVAGQRFYMHHGHYLQKLYQAASRFLQETIHTRTIEDLEVLNAPFLEFGWYNLGQAYNIGKEKLIDKLYFLFKNNNTQQLDRILRLMLKRIERWDNTRARSRWNVLGHVLDYLIQRLGPYLVKRMFFKHTKMFKKQTNPSSGRHQRLSNTLDMAVMDYIQQYLLDASDPFTECTFIFGHTHEPEENYFCQDSDKRCYHLYNTGGWVVDQLDETRQAMVPKATPLYITEDGTVNILPFTQTHHDWLQQQINASSQFDLLRSQNNGNSHH